MSKEIVKARQVMRESFEKDPDFKRAYRDNIACIIMDNYDLENTDETYNKRNKVAEQIIDRLFN